MQIEILKGKSGKWYWRLKSKNGRILASSETYSARKKAIDTVASVRQHFLCDEVKVFLNGEIINLLPVKA